MGRQLSGLGIFAKWLVIPALMAATGYFFIGPRIGGEILPGVKKPAEPPAKTVTAQAPPDEGDTPPAKVYTEPEVTIEAAPAGRIHRLSDGTRTHKKKRKKTVVAPEDQVNPPDDGGSGGAATAGGTGDTTSGGDTGGATTGGTDGGH